MGTGYHGKMGVNERKGNEIIGNTAFFKEMNLEMQNDTPKVGH